MSASGALTALGAPSEFALHAIRERLRSTYTASWQRTSELRERLGAPRPSSESLRRALLLEAQAGLIERDPPLEAGDARGKSHRWRLRPTDQVPPRQGPEGLHFPETKLKSVSPSL